MQKWFPWVLCLVLLSGCTSYSGTVTGGVTPTSGAATPASAAAPLATGALATIDWANTTYPDVCQINGGSPVTVKNGEATGSDGRHLYVTDPVFGYLTRTDAVDAIVPYECAGATGAGVRIMVFAGEAAHPTLIGRLPLDAPQYALSSVFGEGIVNHKLQLSGLGFSANTIPLCCPDVWVNDLYTWNGSAFTLSGHQATQLGKQLASS